MPDLRHVESWVFDLDNTLYPAECRLFSQIDRRMADFIRFSIRVDEAEARRLQKRYYVEYGTTLAGLMAEHGTPPDDFLDYVHDIDHSAVPHDARLKAAIAALPGRRFVFTNGSVAHAAKVLGRIGLDGLFDDVFDIKAADFTPKPHRGTYEKFLAACRIAPAAAAMFEDLAHNLEAAHDLGMTTILIAQDAAWFADEPADKRPARPGDARPPHVHHVTDDLAGFLQCAVAPPQSSELTS
ncbi:MAG: pyrimidine 5'-nucleotidase [Parvularculaceae bacterium]|nr:pyrimidine 5'-nucleotidase [Parvularculaceae bacterium]